MTDEAVPIPPGINPDCLQNPNLCRRYGSVVTAYDPNSRTGGVFYNGQWLIFHPIDHLDFAARAARATAVVRQGEAEMQAQQDDSPSTH